jgi:hypothetical protein
VMICLTFVLLCRRSCRSSTFSVVHSSRPCGRVFDGGSTSTDSPDGIHGSSPFDSLSAAHYERTDTMTKPAAQELEHDFMRTVNGGDEPEDELVLRHGCCLIEANHISRPVSGWLTMRAQSPRTHLKLVRST